tara:strand:- start:199 stop:462 length:264 start_codon:yes stop_codon:yes gene_type:complete
MCLGGKTTTSPTATNTNYFGKGPWGDIPGGATPDIMVPPPVRANPAIKQTSSTPTKSKSTASKTRSAGLKIGGAGKVNQPTSGTINY